MLTNILLATVLQVAADTGQHTPTGLWYSVQGSGPTVVLLHGSNLDSRSWGDLPAALASNYRVVRTDLRSHGRSRDATGPFSWSDDITEVLDAAGAPRAVLIGHSLGAQIAIDIAVARPARVSALVLIAGSIGGLPLTRPPVGFDSLVAALRRGDLPEAGRTLGQMPVMTLYRDTTRQREVRDIVAQNTRLFRADRRWVRALDPPAVGRLSEIGIPTLVLSGERDPTESSEAGRVILERVPGARGVTLPACGHLLPLDCAPETLRAIRTFLDTAIGRTP